MKKVNEKIQIRIIIVRDILFKKYFFVWKMKIVTKKKLHKKKKIFVGKWS